MFKTLAALAQHSPVHVVVSAEGDKLRANINRKPDDEHDVEAISLSLLGTPEELDVELPLALAEAFLKGEAPTSIADQVKAQATAGEAEEPAVVKPEVEKLPRVKVRKAAARSAKPKAEKPPKAAKAEKPSPAPKARKRRTAATNTPEGSGAVAPAESAPAAESSTAAGTAAPVGETTPPALETNPPSGETNSASSETAPPAAETPAAAPASARDTSTLDLF